MQRPTTIITATNRIVPGIELHVTARGDIAFTLNVPQESTPDGIDRAIKDELNRRLQIAQLGVE
jgi:hypothetical protein